MAGIEHDQRARIAGRFRRALSLGLALAVRGGGSACAMVRRKLSRSVAREIEHQPRRLAVGGGEREGLVDPHRPLGVEHDARAALHDQAVAERLHQAAALLAGLGRQLEGDLRQIDHHAIGIGEREGGQIDLLAEVDHKAGLLVVAAEAHVGGHRERVGRRHRPCGNAARSARPPKRPSRRAGLRPSDDNAIARTVTNPTLSAPFYSIRECFG